MMNLAYCDEYLLGIYGTLVHTPVIHALPCADQLLIHAKIANYDNFTLDNDPHGERDFGSVEHEGLRIFWKIAYYAPDMQHSSEDPSDPEQTRRVLTIMLAEEY